MHEGTKCEPKAVIDGELITDFITAESFLNFPLEWAESTDQKKNNSHTNISENYTHPNFLRKWIHETKDPRFLFHRFLNHDADT